MKTASTALKTLLTGGDFVQCDLYTLALKGGTVARYTSADRVIAWSGNTFGVGLRVSDGGVKASVGLTANPVEITILANPSDTLAGANFFSLLRSNGLDGAAIVIDRAFAATWETMAATGPVGTINRFNGRFSAISSMSRTRAVIEAAPWTELLDANMPANVYQTSCAQVLFDAGCSLSRASFASTGTVTGSASTVTAVNTSLSQADGYFSLGKIQFTSGANNGLQRTVKISTSGGALTLVQPLPAAPAAGDTFTIYPGCDLSKSTCQSKFSNLANFRGFPFIPVPEVSL